MKAPTNTTRQTQEYPEGFLQVAMTVGTSNAVEIQEARGQIQLVNSEVLPTRISSGEKKVLEEAGVKFLGPVSGNSIFQHAELPTGWKKVATDHAMWSNLVDDKGRVRAGIFYKAAFYDRDAHLQLRCRYGIAADYELRNSRNQAQASVMDGVTAIYTTPAVPLPSEKNTREWYDASDKATEAAREWLGEHFPDHANPAAYWE